MRNALLLVLLMCTVNAAHADPTLAVWADNAGSLERFGVLSSGEQITIVVTLQTDGSSARYAEWSMPDLMELLPGAFLLSHSTPGDFNCGLDGCLVGPGDFAFSFDDCAAPVAQMEVARFVLLAAGSVDLGDDGLIMAAGPLAADAGMPPRVSGAPGFRDCDLVIHAAAAGGSPELEFACTELIVPAGGLWLNPALCVDAGPESFGTMKARY